MSAALEYLSNQASPEELAAHLSQCDMYFVPPLSARVGIDAYAGKIAVQATTFEAWSGGNLVGLVAAYCNDRETRIAYVTNVSVSPEWMGKGVAERLLNECFTHATAAGMREVHLEVVGGNLPAIKLYEKLGFVMDKVSGALIGMTLDLEKRGSE